MKEDEEDKDKKLITKNTLIQRTYKFIENSIFSFFFCLLQSNDDSFLYHFVAIIINFIQVIGFAFKENKEQIWQSNIFSYIKTFFEYFSLLTYIKYTSWGLYIAVSLIILFLLIFLIFGLIFVLISVSKKGRSALTYKSCMFDIIKWIISLMTTILFIPFTEILLIAFSCKTINGVSVNTIFNEIVCWDINHIIIGIINIYTLIIFFIFSFITSSLYFESSITSSGCISKKNGNLNCLFILIEIIFAISHSFLDNTIFQVVIFFLGSCLLFFKLRHNPPFLNEDISVLWLIFSTLLIWTSIMLVFSYILENTVINGSLYLWLLMVPFIMIIQFTNDDYLLIDYNINVNRFPNSNSVINHCIFILRLIKWDLNNVKKGKLLNGYIMHHNMNCDDQNCPIKKIDFSKSLELKKPMKFGNDNITDTRLSHCFELVYATLYHAVLNTFQHDNELKIHLYCYVITHMDLKEQAISIFNFLKDSKLNFYQKFLVFRYNKLLDYKIQNSNNYDEIVTIEEIEFELEYKFFKFNLEKAATFMMTFWSSLLEPVVDFNKLGSIGSSIQNYHQKIEKNWKSLQKNNLYSLKSFSLYAKFKNDIFDDRITRNAVLYKMKDLEEIRSKKNDFSLKSNKNCIIVIWNDQDRIGKIADLNLACARIFGYFKEDLLSKENKVNMLMPDIFSNIHDECLRFFHAKLDPEKNNVFSRPKLIFCKHKSKFIFPAKLSTRIVQIGSLGAQKIFGNFEIDLKKKNIAYLITNLQGSITNINSVCINYFSLSINIIQERKMSINEIFPGLFETRLNYKGLKGNLIGYQNDDYKTLEDQQFICRFEEYLIKKTEPLCYIFQFEKIINPVFGLKPNYTANLLNTVSNTKDSRRKNKYDADFQFYFDLKSNKMIGGQRNDNKSLRYETEAYDNLPMKSSLNSEIIDKSSREDKFEVVEIGQNKYSEGIRTYVLFNNRLNDIKDIKNDDLDEDNDDQIASIKEKEKKDEEIASIEDKKENILYSVKTYYLFKILFFLIFFVVLCFIILVSVDYVSKAEKIQNIFTIYEAVDSSYQRTSEIQNILGNIREVYLANMGVFGDIKSSATQNKIDTSIIQCKTSLLNLKKIEYILLSQNLLNLVPENTDYLITNIANIFYSDNRTEKIDITKGTQQFYSNVFDLINGNISLITTSNPKIKFIEKNMFNDFWSTLLNYNLNFVKKIAEISDYEEEQILMQIILILIILILFSSYSVFFYYVLINIKKPKQELLSNFLKIKDYIITFYQNKCEIFILSLAAEDENDELNNSFEHDDNDDETNDNEKLILMEERHNKEKTEGSEEGKGKRKRKKSKYQKNNWIFFSMLATLFGIIFTHFFLIMTLNKNIMDIYYYNLPEYNSTCLTETYFFFTDNAQRKIFQDINYNILNKNGIVYIKEDLSLMIQINSQMMKNHVLNIKYLTSNYNQAFSEILMSNLCEKFKDKLSGAQLISCNTIMSASFNQGLTQGLTHFIEGLIFLNNVFENFRTNSNADYFWPDEVFYNITNNKQKDNILNLLQSKFSQEIFQSTDFIKLSFSALKDEFKSNLKIQKNNLLSLMLVITIIFILIVIIGFVGLYLPWIKLLRDEYSKILQLIEIMPRFIRESFVKSNKK